MPNDRGTGKIMKAGLLLAAAIIVVRIILELAGMPETINNVFGVAWLYFLLPVCFAIKIAGTGQPKRFLKLLTDVVLFSIYTRIMVAITYIAAFFLQWKAPRFSSAGGGTVGPDISSLNGIVVIPLRNLAIWVIAATIVGMVIGGITLLFRRGSGMARETGAGG